MFSVKTDLDDLPDVDFAENEALALSVSAAWGKQRGCEAETQDSVFDCAAVCYIVLTEMKDISIGWNYDWQQETGI